MSSRENNNKKKADEDTLLEWAVEKAKFGKRVILGNIDIEQEIDTRKITRSKARKYTSTPSLDEIRDVDPSERWDERNLVFEMGLIAIAEEVIKSLSHQRAPAELVNSMKVLKESMKEGDGRVTKSHLMSIIEKWGGGTSVSNCHLLRHFLSLIIELYPLPQE